MSILTGWSQQLPGWNLQQGLEMLLKPSNRRSPRSRFSRELQRGKRKHDPFFGSLKNRPLPAPPQITPPSKPPPEPVDHGPPKPPPSLRTWFLQIVARGQGDYQVFGEQGLLQQRSGDEGVFRGRRGVRGSAGGGKGFWRVQGG